MYSNEISRGILSSPLTAFDAVIHIRWSKILFQCSFDLTRRRPPNCRIEKKRLNVLVMSILHGSHSNGCVISSLAVHCVIDL